MNEYDSNRIYDLAKIINYEKTENLEETDCYVLNTCHIREKATEKIYHDIGRVKKNLEIKKACGNSDWLRCSSRRRGST